MKGALKLFGLVLGLIALASFLMVPGTVSLVSADTLNETDSSVTVSGVVDVTLNGTTIAFGNVAPGTANSSATTGCPVEITIHADTNTVTTIQVNGTDMTGAGTLEVNNITYCNESDGWKTELNATFSSGADDQYNAYSDWLDIADPTEDITRDAYWYINIPSAQAKGAYSGNIYIKVIDSG